MARDLKVYLRTFSDATGITRLGQYIRQHSAVVRGLTNTYRAAGSVGKAAFGLMNAELRFLRNAAMGGAGAIAVAVREGAKLNVSLAQTVNMASGNKLSNFVKFRTEILNLSSDLGIATDQINAGLYQALSAQMDPDQAFGAIRKAAQGVIADGAELKDVMAGIIAGVKSFGGEVDQTAEQLYRIVQLGQTTFGEVGAYLSQVAPVAAANKISLGEVGGALAQLTSKTIPLSQSVIMLRNMMSRLNDVLGDGWRNSYTFQEAMEAVAKSVNYSQVELGKLFGREGLAGVNAMIGDNFAQARQQAAEFNGELRGLADGAQFVDQFRGFAKIWQSLRNYVKEIGSEIEQRWAPRIQFIAAKIAEMRKGDGWQSLVDRITTRLESSVTWVLVQVKTASDLISHLRDQDFGLARIAAVGGAVVSELVTMAVTLLVAQLLAIKDVLVGLAHMMAAAFEEKMMQIDLPFRNEEKAARNAALGRLRGMTREQAEAEGVNPELAGKQSRILSPEGSKRLKAEIDAWAENLTLAQAAAFATAGNDERLQSAFETTAANLRETKGKVDAQWDASTAAIKASAGSASGGEFNWDQRAAENRAELDSFMNRPLPEQPTPAPSEPRRGLPDDGRRAERLAGLQARATALSSSIDAARGPTPEEERLARWQAEQGSRPWSPQSFTAQQGARKQSAAAGARAEADNAIRDMEAALNEIVSTIRQLAGGLRDAQGQIRNMPDS